MFDNEYEPENSLQKAFNSAYKGCLCGHFEWCPACDGTLLGIRRDIVNIAKDMGYQLYYKAWMSNSYIKLDMEKHDV